MASGYTAYALYSLINPFAAFILMAALAGLALGLSILQGPFVALLGLVAGYSTPMLAQTGQPMAWGLFPYLMLLTARGMAIVRYMALRWLAWAMMAGALLWPAVWNLTAWQTGDALPRSFGRDRGCGVFALQGVDDLARVLKPGAVGLKHGGHHRAAHGPADDPV